MSNSLFPVVEKYISDTDMLNRLKGNQAQLYRIIGQGKTKSKALDFLPADIERKMELVSFKPFKGKDIPREVRKEIEKIKGELESELANLKKRDAQKRLANQTLRSLIGVKSGTKDNHFFAGRLVLVMDKAGKKWSWCLTPHYPIISNIPPDHEYLAKSYHEAEKLLSDIIMSADTFDLQLNLAWSLARRRFSRGDKVLIIDVARMYKVAGQPDKFWNTPKKGNFVDLPDAAFIANLINWRRSTGKKTDFKLQPATMQQALSTKAKVFYMPSNNEGTQTRPVVYISKRS